MSAVLPAYSTQTLRWAGWIGKAVRRRYPPPMLRTAAARKMARGMRPAVERVIRSQVYEAAERVTKGMAPVPADYADRWADGLRGAMRRRALAIGIAGFRWAGRELEGKSIDEPDAVETLFRVSETREDFVLDPVGVEVEDWLEQVGAKSTATNAKRIQKEFDDALAYVDPETGRGRTPYEIGKRLRGMAPDFSKARARMIANTTTMYAFNGGIREQYIARQVEVLEWWTSQDDAVCPHCAGMHGERVRSTDPFWEEGDLFTAQQSLADGSVSDVGLNISYDVYHPPLHPNCACTLLPVTKTALAGTGQLLQRGGGGVAAQGVGIGRGLVASQETKKAERLPIKKYGEVTGGFEREVERIVDDLPGKIRRRLKRQKIEIRVGHHLTQARPDLRGVHPRGWSAGSTWDDVSAYGTGEVGGNVGVFQYRRPFIKGTGKEWLLAGEPRGGLPHELGHAWNATGRKKAVSARKVFMRAYYKDVEELTKIQRTDFSYLLQAGYVGRDETFAELFSLVLTGHAAGHSYFTANLPKAFPRTYAYVRRLLTK